jgi:hypothetical protein
MTPDTMVSSVYLYGERVYPPDIIPPAYPDLPTLSIYRKMRGFMKNIGIFS